MHTFEGLHIYICLITRFIYVKKVLNLLFQNKTKKKRKENEEKSCFYITALGTSKKRLDDSDRNESLTNFNLIIS